VATERFTNLGLFLAHTASAASDRTGFVLFLIGILVVVAPVVVPGVVGRSIVTIGFCI
jgi:hypothetical protein